jgi:hypothetical protein
MEEWMNIEHWWNDTNRGMSIYSEKNPFQYLFVHHKSHLSQPDIKPDTVQREAENWLPAP